MLGAIVGDIISSRFILDNDVEKDFEFFSKDCFFTQGTILSLATAQAIVKCEGSWSKLKEETRLSLESLGKKYYKHLESKELKDILKKKETVKKSKEWIFVEPAIVCGFFARNELEAKNLANITCGILHQQQESINATEAVSIAVFMAKNGNTKTEIFTEFEKNYFSFSNEDSLEKALQVFTSSLVDLDIVSKAMRAFFESFDFIGAIHDTLKLGEKSTCVSMLAGGIAEAYYGIDYWSFEPIVFNFLPKDLRNIYKQSKNYLSKIYKPRHYSCFTKYIEKLYDSLNLHHFFGEFYAFANKSPYNLSNYNKILKKAKLKWTEKSLFNANIESYNEKTILAIITAILRAEKFTDGIFQKFVASGHIDRCLLRLKKLDRPKKTSSRSLANFKLKISKGSHTEILIISSDRIKLTVNSKNAFSFTNEYKFPQKKFSAHCELILKLLSDALSSKKWNEFTQNEKENTFSHHFVYELKAEYENSEKLQRKGNYSRVDIPEKAWNKAINAICKFLPGEIPSEILSRMFFMQAIKPGEVKYCGVLFSEGGHIYHYRTRDLTLMPGDEVIVPVGPENIEEIACIETIQFCKWDNTPYPLEKTKEIIGRLDKNEPSARAESPMLIEKNR
ncbi:MAG: DUF6508 domain-containing protein [Treponemataceae bacterium]